MSFMSIFKPHLLVSRLTFTAAVASSLLVGCATRTGKIEQRTGDEIIVAGKMVHTGTRVVTWMDPGGYDAYRVERRFAPYNESDWQTSTEKVKDLRSPARYSLRKSGLTDEQIEKVRGGGWDLPMLQDVVDQFVLHFDVAGISKTCFKVLHDSRDLSVHFMLDVDGTIYQTLDLKERAWHATSSNNRSIGIEIANMGAYSKEEKSPLPDWYKQKDGKTLLTIPARAGTNVLFTKNFVGHPARPELVKGEIQGHMLSQYDYTPEQYEALARLTATLCSVFPKIKCDYPRDAAGKLVPHKLADSDLEKYQGVLGHYHIQTNKTDPGPALQWDYVIGKARQILHKPADHAAVNQIAHSVKLDRGTAAK
jgi:N-acetylmuramoyl-L-alanine amidase